MGMGICARAGDMALLTIGRAKPAEYEKWALCLK